MRHLDRLPGLWKAGFLMSLAGTVGLAGCDWEHKFIALPIVIVVFVVVVLYTGKPFWKED